MLIFLFGPWWNLTLDEFSFFVILLHHQGWPGSLGLLRAPAPCFLRHTEGRIVHRPQPQASLCGSWGVGGWGLLSFSCLGLFPARVHGASFTQFHRKASFPIFPTPLSIRPGPLKDTQGESNRQSPCGHFWWLLAPWSLQL